MKPIGRIAGRAAVYPGVNVDTDQIIPARYLSRSRVDGYGAQLFHDLRVDEKGVARPDFVLNRPQFHKPVVLIAGVNFACGSSREQAVWAIYDHGIQCVIAASFSDIFRNSAVENGLLTITLPAEPLSRLTQSVIDGAPCDVEVDLAQQQIAGPDGAIYPFEFDDNAKQSLLKGLSSIDSTLLLQPRIDAFERNYRARYPWFAASGS